MRGEGGNLGGKEKITPSHRDHTNVNTHTIQNQNKKQSFQFRLVSELQLFFFCFPSVGESKGERIFRVQGSTETNRK